MGSRSFSLASLLAWLFPVAVIAGSLSVISNIGTSFDTRVFLSDQNRSYQDLQRFEQTFRRTSQVYLLVEYGSRRVDDPAFAAVIRQMTEAAWQVPLATRVDSLANAPYVFEESGAISVEPALDYALSGRDAKHGGPLHSNLNLNRYVSEDGRVAGVVITCDVPVGTEKDVKEISRAARELVRRFEADYPELNVLVTGEIPLMETFGKAAAQDSALLVPVSLFVVLSVVALFLRNLRMVAALILNALMAVCISLVLFSARGLLLNSATSLIPLVLLVVLSANSLHLLLAIKAAMKTRLEAADAVRFAVRQNALPIIVASVTTALGFLLLETADAPPFGDLGLHVAVGVAAGTAGLLLWMPALFILSPTSIQSAQTVEPAQVPTRLSRLDQFFQRSGPMVFLWVCVGVGALGLLRLRIDDNFIEYFDNRFEIRTASDFAAEHLGGPNYLDIQIRAPQDGTVYSPAYQEELREFSSWLRARPLVANVVSVADVLDEVNRAFGTRDSVGDLSEDEIAQYLLTFELSLGAGQDLTDYIDIERKSTRANALLRRGSSQEIVALERRIYEWFGNRGVGEDRVLVTGINIPTAHMSLVNIQGMLSGILGTVCALVFLIWVYFRSLAFAISGLAALVLPIAMGFGIWGWLAGSIGMAAAAVAAITVGVVVDDAVHLLFRYRRLRVQGSLSPKQSMEKARGEVGQAITVSSVALIIGFSLLVLSGFAVNNTLGLCTALVLLCAWLFDLYLLPPVLVRLDTYAGAFRKTFYKQRSH